jgi:hypothetical protein
MRKVIKLIALAVAVALAIKWSFNPAGPYEPFLALITTSLVLWDFLSPNKGDVEPLPRLHQVAPKDVDVVPTAILKSNPSALPRYTWNSTSDFFQERFSSAFPGIRKTSWFSGQEGLERVLTLLKPPLTFKTVDSGEVNPIWWFGRGNLQITNCKQVDVRTLVINVDEYKVSRVAAIYSSSYRRIWVYLETEALLPTGLYAHSQSSLEIAKAKGETYAEEYGIYKGMHKVTRAEYDDGHAMVNGKIEHISGECELRVRHLTPYNLVICAHESPINNSEFDQTLEQLLDSVLRDPASFGALEENISRLPITKSI